MRKEYDLTKMKRVYPSYLKKLKKQVTIKLDGPVIEYFKEQAEKTGIPYQNLINFYLRDCMISKMELELNWKRTG
jgi:uncharacterized protein (DUF4415 family)